MSTTHTLHPDLAGNNALLASLGYDFVIQELIEVIREGLKRDGLVRLHQFGTFRLRYSKPRIYKHPKTGASRTLPAAPRVTFKPAKNLREKIQKNQTPVTENPVSEKVMPAIVAAKARQVEPSRQVEVTSHYIPVDKKDKNYNLPLLGVAAIGLLAAIPFIISTLQNDFETPVKEITSAPIVKKITNVNVTAPDIMVTDQGRNQLQVQAQDQLKNQADFQSNVQNNIQNKAAPNLQKTDVLIPDIIVSDTRPEMTEPSEVSQTISQPASKTVSQVTNTASLDITNAQTYFLRPAVHQVNKGESLWRLAAKHYNNPLYWPYIYRANQRVLTNPNNIEVNMKLVIPGLQNSPDNLSDRDRQAIAKGYYLVYEYHIREGNNQAKDYLIGARRFDSRIIARKMDSIG